MKKLYLILASVLLATGLSFAQVNVGGHAAVNFSSLYGDHTDDIPWGFGFAAGVAAKAAITPMISVVPEVDIDLRRQSDDDVSWKTWALEIPILARISVAPMLYVELGPQLAFLLSSKQESEHGAVTETFDLGKAKVLNTFEFGLAAGAGYTVIPNLDVNFRAAFGLTSIADGKKWYGEDASVKNIQFQVGATYWFM